MQYKWDSNPRLGARHHGPQVNKRFTGIGQNPVKPIRGANEKVKRVTVGQEEYGHEDISKPEHRVRHPADLQRIRTEVWHFEDHRELFTAVAASCHLDHDRFAILISW